MYDPRLLAVCAGGGFLLGAVPGLVVAVATGGPVLTGLASGVIFVGGALLVMGLFAALEPPQGWSGTNKRKGHDDLGRRSLLTRVAFEIESIELITSADLLIWAGIVGGGLIGLGIGLYVLGE